MLNITDNADITKMTTFGIKAGCGRLVEYETASDLKEALDRGLLRDGFMVLGGGSNMLFVNGFHSGTMLHSTDRSASFAESGDNTLMTCGAGMTLDEACQLTCGKGLWGMENLSAIPGTVGGAAVQNAGAYGVEICDVLDNIEYFDTETGRTGIMEASQCGFGYRTSVFKTPEVRERLIILSTTFRLSRTPKPVLGYKGLSDLPAEGLTPMTVRSKIMAIREAKLPSPTETGSAGSFFKNPVVTAEAYANICRRSDTEPSAHRLPDGSMKISAAWLIDHAGCKSFRVGGASLWPSQPLVIVNSDHATGRDVADLCTRIVTAVEDRFGVLLMPEVIFIN